MSLTPTADNLRIAGILLLGGGIGLHEWLDDRAIHALLLGTTGAVCFGVSFPTAVLELMRYDIQRSKGERRPLSHLDNE